MGFLLTWNATVGAKDGSDYSIPSDGVSFTSEKATINNQGISNAGYYICKMQGEAYCGRRAHFGKNCSAALV